MDGWGRDKFISNAVLREPTNGLIVNNKVIFRVEITVFGDLGKRLRLLSSLLYFD